MRAEVELATPLVGDVCVQLGRREVGVPEHLLHRAQVGAALQQVRRERVSEQVRVYAPGLEAGLGGELAKDEERAGAGQGAALRVEEQRGVVARVEVRPPVREI